MTTPRARYVGDGSGYLTPDFPESLRRKLRKSLAGWTEFTAKQIGTHRAFRKGCGEGDWRLAHPADEIVSALLEAAYRSKVSLSNRKRLALKKGELLAEHADLLKVLRGARKKLRSISLELDRLLGIEMFDTGADPLGIADRLEKLVSSVEAAGPLVKKHPDLPRNRVFSNGVAQQLAREVLRVFGENGILTTVSSNCMASPLIATLSSIGEAMDLHLAANTWKNVVSKARKEQHAFDQ